MPTKPPPHSAPLGGGYVTALVRVLDAAERERLIIERRGCRCMGCLSPYPGGGLCPDCRALLRTPSAPR